MSESQETSPSLPAPQAGAEGGLTSAGLRRTLRRMSPRYPRAPSSAAWAAMSPEEQARVHASLPGEVTEEEDPEAPGRYQRLVPQGGRYHSERLGVDLVVEQGRLRFYIGDTLLLEFEELVAQLRQETQQWKARAEEEAKKRRREARRRRAAEKARDEEARRRQQAEEENARLKEENARLKALLH